MTRAIAFYLPQFHPIPENDLWWGKGFTEWTNVTRCAPRFQGHYQPHLPADLGFYDLRLAETRTAQANLAKEYGLSGFCYYHYWFTGRRILERPFQEVLESGQPDFPFCLCWANENWTRRWDGAESEVLLSQTYSEEDDKHHIESLLTAFHDPRYIRINGRPVFAIYRLSQLPQPVRTIALWRSVAIQSGLPGLFICNVESNATEHGLASQLDLDAAIEFAPDWTALPPRRALGMQQRILRRLSRLFGLTTPSNDYRGSYEVLMRNMINKPPVNYLRFPCVTPMWDNAARRQTSATTLTGSTPKAYEQWLCHALDSVKSRTQSEQVVFINGWNEWAEGNHLEPCQTWGHEYLKSTSRALLGCQNGSRPAPSSTNDQMPE